MSDFILQFLDFAEECSREVDADRKSERKRLQAEGIAAARENGTKFGRPPMELPDNFEDIVRLQRNGEFTITRAAEILNMPNATYRFRTKKIPVIE